jgi:putative ABC transport system permease protein
MGSLYRTLSLRYLQQRWARATLVVASIALGVATLVATRALNQSVWTAARAATTPFAGLGDLHVTNGEAGVRRALADRLAHAPGVHAAEPLVVGRVRLLGGDDARHALVLGILWKAENAERNPWGVQIDWAVSPDHVPGLKGTDPQDLLVKIKRFGIRPVLVGSDLAKDLGSVIVRIQAAGQKTPTILTKVGTIRAEGAVAELARNVLILDAADAAELLGQRDLVHRIDLFLEPGADREQVQARVRDLVGGQAAVRTPEEDDQRIEDVMAGLQLGFSLCGASALVIGLFLVYNALAVSVAERRHEIGMLRSLGATRGQVWGLFVGEAALLGLAGALLGVPAGYGLAQVGLAPLKEIVGDLFGPLDSRSVTLTEGMILLAVGAGLATAVLAALVPAVRAAHEEPAAAVRRVPQVPGLGHHALQLAGSFLLVGGGLACMVCRAWLPARMGIFGGFVLVLLGLLLTNPLLAAGLARLFQPLARRVLGIEARLAADNLVRSPGRTGLVITAVAAGVAMFLQSAGVIRSNEDPIFAWIDQSIAAELFVTSGSPVVGTGQNLLLPADLPATIKKKLPAVRAALPLRSRLIDYGETLVYLQALDAAGFAAINQGRVTVPGLELLPRLASGERKSLVPSPAIVSENFAALHKVKPGDVISLRSPHGLLNLEVIGTVVDYSWNRGSVLIDRTLYQDYFDDPLIDEIAVYLRPGEDAEAVRGAISQRWGNELALLVLTRDEDRKYFKGTIRRLYGVAYSQEIVVGLVAALGVLTALLISVLQRRRELGILRALGATRGQVLRSVLAEATLMGLIGTLIGLAVGIPVEWYIVRFILLEETGFYFPLCIPWLEAGSIAALALVVATLAGLGPALHTTRLRIPEAIAYE